MFARYHGFTNNQMYKRAFHELLMRPNPAIPGTFLGNSQREDFLPILRERVRTIAKGNANVLDIGAGSGEILEIALKDLENATLFLEEPNSLLLDRYVSLVSKYPSLKLGAVYPGPAEDFYFYTGAVGREWFECLPQQDLILAIHMIYHLTPFFGGVEIDPGKDLEEMIKALYRKLKTGGSIFLVYAEQTKSVGGGTGMNYFESRSPDSARRLKTIGRNVTAY